MQQKPQKERILSEIEFLGIVRKLNKKDFKLLNGLLKTKENLIMDLNRITNEVKEFLLKREVEQITKLMKLKSKIRRDRKDKKLSE